MIQFFNLNIVIVIFKNGIYKIHKQGYFKNTFGLTKKTK